MERNIILYSLFLKFESYFRTNGVEMRNMLNLINR